PTPPEMLNTSGSPVTSVAPVRRARAESDVLGAMLGPTGLRIGAPPGARPMTEMPSAFRAATVSGTVADPTGATAPATVLREVDGELLTNPKRLEPGMFEQSSAVVGTVAPPAPVISGGTGWPAVNGATGQMSPALRTRCSAPARKPTPPSVPEDGATFDENGGTSRLTRGEVWVSAAPAGPLSRADPLPLPSKPLPVAICLSASMLPSGPSPPKPGAVRLRAEVIRPVKFATSGVTIGWPSVNGRPTVLSWLKVAPGPP